MATLCEVDAVWFGAHNLVAEGILEFGHTATPLGTVLLEVLVYVLEGTGRTDDLHGDIVTLALERTETGQKGLLVAFEPAGDAAFAEDLLAVFAHFRHQHQFSADGAVELIGYWF